MREMPKLRIELEGLRQNVAHCFNANNDELNALVIDTIEKTLTAEWVRAEVQKSVNGAVKAAVEDVANDYHLKQALTTHVSEAIASLIKNQNQKGNKNANKTS